jgi:nucleotide-binding universal stress UspA family protein
MGNDKGEGRIVVGIDGSQESYRALHWAIDEARVRGFGVLVVHALDYGVAMAHPFVGQTRIFGELTEAAQAVLDLGVAHARARARDVSVQGALVHGSPGMALVHASEGAALLVVGSRGHGGFVGAILGSTSTACIHHAVCPVVVIPPANRGLQTAKKEPAAAGPHL